MGNSEVKVCANCLFVGYSTEGEKYCSNLNTCVDFSKWRPGELVNETSKYERIGTEAGKLVAEKNLAYGDAFSKTGDFMRLLYPDGIKPGQYKDALCLVRMFDKMVRIATDKDAFGESPFRDLCGYSILGVANSERGKEDV